MLQRSPVPSGFPQCDFPTCHVDRVPVSDEKTRRTDVTDTQRHAVDIYNRRWPPYTNRLSEHLDSSSKVSYTLAPCKHPARHDLLYPSGGCLSSELEYGRRLQANLIRAVLQRVVQTQPARLPRQRLRSNPRAAGKKLCHTANLIHTS